MLEDLAQKIVDNLIFGGIIDPDSRQDAIILVEQQLWEVDDLLGL